MVIMGWKNIARYLGCGVRTAQRWHSGSRLPVRRPSAGNKGPVIALSDEIDAWVRQSNGKHLGLADNPVLHHRQLLAALKSSLSEQKKLLKLLQKSMSDLHFPWITRHRSCHLSFLRLEISSGPGYHSRRLQLRLNFLDQTFSFSY